MYDRGPTIVQDVELIFDRIPISLLDRREKKRWEILPVKASFSEVGLAAYAHAPSPATSNQEVSEARL
jgi:hypothetical protein